MQFWATVDNATRVIYCCQQQFSTQGEEMTTKEAIAYFGGIKALADALHVWPQAIYKWGEEPPMAKQYELEVRTNGSLKARIA